MTELKRVSGIDIDEDMEYQWREWRVHRIGWAIFGLILLAGLLGLLGQGPLANARAGEPGSPLVLDYQRLDRYQAPTRLEVSLGPNVGQQDEVRLALNHDFLDRVEIERIDPEPESVEAGQDATTYVFKVANPGQTSQVRFDYKYELAGRAQGELRLEGGPTVQFNAFVFP